MVHVPGSCHWQSCQVWETPWDFPAFVFWEVSEVSFTHISTVQYNHHKERRPRFDLRATKLEDSIQRNKMFLYINGCFRSHLVREPKTTIDFFQDFTAPTGMLSKQQVAKQQPFSTWQSASLVGIPFGCPFPSWNRLLEPMRAISDILCVCVFVFLDIWTKLFFLVDLYGYDIIFARCFFWTCF